MLKTTDFGVTHEEIQSFPSFCDRFFTKFFYEKKIKDTIESEDHEVLIHSNGICLIGLAKTHPVMSKTITQVNFNIGNVDRSQNSVKGKSKKGGMILQELTTLCKIRCSDGSEYGIVSCVQGKLVEVNKRLVEDPSLIKTDGGYIAVILPKSSNLNAFKKSHKLVRERQSIGIQFE